MQFEERDFGEPELYDYHEKISCCFRHEDIILILIRKIRSAQNEIEAMIVWEKYRQWPFASRFWFYNRDEKIETIKKQIEVLDYFGIEYPVLPESIKEVLDDIDTGGEVI